MDVVVRSIDSVQMAQIGQILRALDERPPGKEADRRVRLRMALRMSLGAMLLGQSGVPAVPIHTRNISTAGLGFLSRRVFKKGEAMAVHLRAGRKVSKLVLCRTSFCRYVRGGMHEVGVEFEEACGVTGGTPRIPTRWVEQAQKGGKMMAEAR